MKAGAHKPTYRSWQMMKNRCLNPNATDYTYYGGKGVKIDPTRLTYEGFVSAMGLRPEGLTLDRKDSSKHYVLGNCRWATKETQSRNRAYTLDLTFGGRTQKVWEWAAELGTKPTTLHHRRWQLHQGLIGLPQVFRARQRRAAT